MIALRRTRSATFIALVLTATSVLSGCTVSAVKASKPGSPVAFSALRDRGENTVLGRDVALKLNLGEFSFSPTFVRVVPGATVEMVLTNRGREVHTFVIDGYDVNDQLEPGRPRSESVVAPTSGTLVFYCRLHRYLGMQGAIVVTPRVAPAR